MVASALHLCVCLHPLCPSHCHSCCASLIRLPPLFFVAVRSSLRLCLPSAWWTPLRRLQRSPSTSSSRPLRRTSGSRHPRSRTLPLRPHRCDEPPTVTLMVRIGRASQRGTATPLVLRAPDNVPLHGSAAADVYRASGVVRFSVYTPAAACAALTPRCQKSLSNAGGCGLRVARTTGAASSRESGGPTWRMLVDEKATIAD